MDPRLLGLLALLYQYHQSQQGGGGVPDRSRQQPGQPQRPDIMPNYPHGNKMQGQFGGNPNNPTSNSPYSPQQMQLLSQIYNDFLNKGGGTVGNDIVGGGSVFGGFYRGPQGSYTPYQTPPNVGNVNFLRGNAPGMGTSPQASMDQTFGQGRLGTGSDIMDPSRAGQSDFFTNHGGAGQLGGYGFGDSPANSYF